MKNFYQYLAESVKEYKYRIKTVVEVNDDFMDKLETCLAKYDVVSVSNPKKTIIQNYPKDFQDVPQSEVYIIDVTTRVPASSNVLLTELTTVFRCSAKFIVVRGENEPNELEAEKMVADIEAAKDGPQEAILNDPDYKEHNEEVHVDFGDDYNKRLLAYLARVSAEKEAITVIPEKGEKLFAWMKEQNAGEDFNKDHDTPKPVHRSQAKKADLPAKQVGNSGNYEGAKRK